MSTQNKFEEDAKPVIDHQRRLNPKMKEVVRNEIDRIFFEQQPLLKHNFLIETLGGPPPPKGDPMFELKPLPGALKYAYLDEKKIYPVIISANLSEHEEEKLLKTLKKHCAAIGYTLDDIKGISPTLRPHMINIEPDTKPIVDHQ